MKKIQITLSRDQIRYFELFYDDPKTKHWEAAAAKNIISAWPLLRSYTLNELKGIFSKKELTSIIDCFETLVINHDYLCDQGMLIVRIADIERYEKKLKNNGVDFVELKSKLEKLTAAQALFLQEWASLFWTGPNEGENIDEYLELLI